MSAAVRGAVARLHPSTARALARHADRLGCDRVSVIEYTEESIAVLVTDTASTAIRIMRDVDGRWVLADYNDRSSQYESSDCPAMAREQSYRYSVSRTLSGLRRIGVRSYPSPVAALATVQP